MSVSTTAQISDHQTPPASGKRVPGSIPVSPCRADMFSHGSSIQRLEHLFDRGMDIAPRQVGVNGVRVLRPHPPSHDGMLHTPILKNNNLFQDYRQNERSSEPGSDLSSPSYSPQKLANQNVCVCEREKEKERKRERKRYLPNNPTELESVQQ